MGVFAKYVFPKHERGQMLTEVGRSENIILRLARLNRPHEDPLEKKRTEPSPKWKLEHLEQKTEDKGRRFGPDNTGGPTIHNRPRFASVRLDSEPIKRINDPDSDGLKKKTIQLRQKSAKTPEAVLRAMRGSGPTNADHTERPTLLVRTPLLRPTKLVTGCHVREFRGIPSEARSSHDTRSRTANSAMRNKLRPEATPMQRFLCPVEHTGLPPMRLRIMIVLERNPGQRKASVKLAAVSRRPSPDPRSLHATAAAIPSSLGFWRVDTTCFTSPKKSNLSWARFEVFTSCNGDQRPSSAAALRPFRLGSVVNSNRTCEAVARVCAQRPVYVSKEECRWSHFTLHFTLTFRFEGSRPRLKLVNLVQRTMRCGEGGKIANKAINISNLNLSRIETVPFSLSIYPISNGCIGSIHFCTWLSWRRTCNPRRFENSQIGLLSLPFWEQQRVFVHPKKIEVEHFHCHWNFQLYFLEFPVLPLSALSLRRWASHLAGIKYGDNSVPESRARLQFNSIDDRTPTPRQLGLRFRAQRPATAEGIHRKAEQLESGDSTYMISFLCVGMGAGDQPSTPGTPGAGSSHMFPDAECSTSSNDASSAMIGYTLSLNFLVKAKSHWVGIFRTNGKFPRQSHKKPDRTPKEEGNNAAQCSCGGRMNLAPSSAALSQSMTRRFWTGTKAQLLELPRLPAAANPTTAVSSNTYLGDPLVRLEFWWVPGGRAAVGHCDGERLWRLWRNARSRDYHNTAGIGEGAAKGRDADMPEGPYRREKYRHCDLFNYSSG
ncbi:hypothetical protein DFH06DRAFT_1143858 [Mycena polygramma]|nr:hypothetical protein DFH06DRAFT_1143858 [Mycena polygramma]